MGTDTALVLLAPTTNATGAGVGGGGPVNVVWLRSRLEVAHPVGGDTVLMLKEVTVMGTDSGLVTLYQR